MKAELSIALTSSITRVQPTSTNTEPAMYELKITGIGTELACIKVLEYLFNKK